MNDEKKNDHLNQIQAQVNRLVGMLDDVLLISRAEKVSLNVSAEPVDMEAFCAEIVSEIQQTTQQHHIAFTVSGSCSGLYLDTKLIRQAATNLLTNAVKYSPEGGTVSIDLVCDDRQLRIRIKDEGIGITEADQKRLFETFHRGQNVGTISGTGLGLAIVKRAVEAHKGTITVESAVGMGTTFTIRIPLQTAVTEDS
jgi:signal transduction histidine kinase